MSSKTQNVLAARLASIKAKSTELTFKDVEVPVSSANFLSTFKDNSALKEDRANEWTIDLFPNMIEPSLFIMSLAQSHATKLDYRAHAKSSTATIAMYHTAILYGYFLLNDMYVRPQPSSQAQSWLQVSPKKDFADFLATLPVPEELESLLSQYAACQSERTPNVFVIPSAAGFHHDTHFGRFIPLSFYAALHDTAAELPGNSPRLEVLKNLFNRKLYRCRNNASATTNNFSCSVMDILGYTQVDSTTTAEYHNSKLYQMFTAIFNPVLFRDYQRRSSLASLSFPGPTFSTHDPNAYDLLFSYTKANLKELKVVLQAVSSLFEKNVSCKRTLLEVISASSGISALVHGQSTFALPTWSSNPKVNPDNISGFSLIQNEDVATRISFLQQITAAPHQTALPTIKVTKKADNSDITDQVNIRPLPLPFSTVNPTADPANTAPKFATDFEIFDEDQNVHPRVLVFDITASATVDGHLALLAGKIIETFEIDGTVIQFPNINKSLGIQNSQFSDSMIPTRYTISAMKWYSRAAGSISPPLKRAKPARSSRLPAASVLINRTQMTMPLVVGPLLDAAIPTRFPGLSVPFYTNWIEKSLRYIGFTTVDETSHAATDDDIYAIGDRRLYVWSPYTFNGYETEEDYSPVHSDTRTYFITNFASIFGSDINYVESKHPFEAIPIF